MSRKALLLIGVLIGLCLGLLIVQADRPGSVLTGGEGLRLIVCKDSQGFPALGLFNARDEPVALFYCDLAGEYQEIASVSHEAIR